MSLARPPRSRPAVARVAAAPQKPGRATTLLASGALCAAFWIAVVYAVAKLAALG